MRLGLLAQLIGFGLFLAVGAPVSAQVEIGFGGVEHDASQPVEVISDSLEINQETGQAVFAGNVIVVQGDLRLAAQRVEVNYSENDTGPTEVRDVIASGGVLVTRGTDAAEGAEARYAVGSAELVMSGDVLVTQGATAIAGDRLVVNMQTGAGTVEGRVRTVLGTGGDQ